MLSTNRWIQKTGQNRVYLPSTTDSFLLCSSQEKGIHRTKKIAYMDFCRPKIEGSKQVTVAKDTIYHLMNLMLEKHQIQGNYIGLAANRIPEIYVTLKEHITNNFVSCQIHKRDFQRIKPWVDKHVIPSYKQVNFTVKRIDIFKEIGQSKQEFSIFDLDLMCCLTTKTIFSTACSLPHSAAKKSLLALWHCSGRGITDSEINRRARPWLREGLRENFNIIDDETYNYAEAQPPSYHAHPMRVDLLVLKMKG